MTIGLLAFGLITGGILGFPWAIILVKICMYNWEKVQ